MSTNNQKAPKPQKSSDAAVEAAQPAAPEAGTQAPAWKVGDKAYIVAVYGRMVHLHSNEEFSERPVKVVIDDFTAAQLNAGKLAIANDD